MKLRTFAAAFLLTLCAAAWAAAHTPRPAPKRAAGQTGRVSTLVCRMGGKMMWTIDNNISLVQTQLNGQNVRVPVVVGLTDRLKFAKSAVPAKPDASNLAPGVCGLTERAMTASDPDQVISTGYNDFTLKRTRLWDGESLSVEETTMLGGSLNDFFVKQPFSMQVTLFPGNLWKVVDGTKPKPLP
jgi:hypothetical protein